MKHRPGCKAGAAKEGAKLGLGGYGAATVDAHDLPRDVGRCQHAKEHDERRDLLGLAHAAQWDARALRPPIFCAVSGSSCMPLLLASSVRVPPGDMQLTRMPSPAHSTARLRVSWFTAALLAEYTDMCELAMSPQVEEMFTMGVFGYLGGSNLHGMRDPG